MKALILIFILSLSCNSDLERNTVNAITHSSSTAHETRKILKGKDTGNLTYRIIETVGNTFGYDIYRDGQLLIHQPQRPALSGKSGFDTREDAEKVARLVIRKIQKGVMPPTVEIDEMKQLRVIN